MRIRTASRAVTLSCVVALAGCGAKKPEAPPEPALVAVEVVGSIPVPEAAAPRVAIVLDASTSMREPAARGVSRLAAAQTLVGDVLSSLPDDARFSVDALGLEAGESCAPSVGVVAPSPAVVGGEAASVVEGLTARGEGSLAGALDGVVGALRDEGSLDGARVLAVSDLESDCGGDLCAAVETLVSSGAGFDLVVLGPEPTPSCVSAATPGRTTPPAQPTLPPLPSFRVLPEAGSDVEGRAGDPPVKAPAGLARIVIALDPPLEVGPIRLGIGALVRVRVLDFAASDPPVRDWSIEVVASGADLAGAPPPPEP